MRVFFDANVLFSAAKSNGAVRQLARLLVEPGHECWADAYVVAEARRNLIAKGAASAAHVGRIAVAPRLAPALAASPAGAVAGQVQWLPDKSRPVLAAAIRRGREALVTGERTHFGSVCGKVFGGVAIHSRRSLVGHILGLRPDFDSSGAHGPGSGSSSLRKLLI